MSNYQQIVVSTGASVSEPGPLPEFLVGLADATLANLSASLDASQMAEPHLAPYAGMGFIPVADPPPAPSTIMSRDDFLRLFTLAEEGAIATSTDPNIAAFRFEMTIVSAVDRADPNTVRAVTYMGECTPLILAAGRGADILAGNPPPAS